MDATGNGTEWKNFGIYCPFNRIYHCWRGRDRAQNERVRASPLKLNKFSILKLDIKIRLAPFGFLCALRLPLPLLFRRRHLNMYGAVESAIVPWVFRLSLARLLFWAADATHRVTYKCVIFLAAGVRDNAPFHRETV